mmetsp:Transcript_57427/g.140159  ORF Transcript_57427/g.140159 Transcript_57427/m.140159 type:complete len:465 (-) Transcript_57427:265-1659(-)
MADATDLVEERLGTLEAWLEEEPDNQSLNDKRDEYLGLLEELELLQKKLRKTAKLLLQESNEKTLVKLAKKEEQYSHEIEDLVQYVQSDAMFDEATMEPSELLGEPLETLIEQPGLEGSSGTLNISLSDMPYFPQRQRSSGSASNINYNNSRGRLALNPDDDSEFDDLHPISEAEESSHNMSSMASLTQSMQSLEASNQKKKQPEILYDSSTLRKKLKKVEKMIRGEKDPKKAKKLKKKRDQYQQELLQVNSAATGGGSSDDGEMSSIDRSLDLDSIDKGLVSKDESSCDTVDLLAESTVSLESMGKSLRSLKSTGSKHYKTYDASTLKKKMKKVKKLLAATDDEEEREKYILKFDEYEQALQELHSQSFHASGGDIGEEPKSAQQSNRTVSTAGSSSSTVQKSGDGSGMSGEEKERYKMLQQKMQKAKKLIKSAKDQGDTERAGKLEKKRQQYKAEIEALKQR